MACAFGQAEQHDVVVKGRRNRRICGPVVSQVMDKHAIITLSCHHTLSNAPTWIVWGTYNFNEGFVTLGLKCRGVTTPVKQLRLQVLDGLSEALASPKST